MNSFRQKVGAFYKPNGQCEFNVWAPLISKVELVVHDTSIEMIPDDFGYWHATGTDMILGSRYKFKLDGNLEVPDPASVSQPDGPTEASQIIERSFAWNDETWKGLPMREMVIYELHVGTFTLDGTFEAIISRLQYLKELGINAIEIMPVAEFPGVRNWGYDGVSLFATSSAYGGAAAFKTLINAAHQMGIAVILDVVYNHLGPDGNFLKEFAPYFTEKYKTPWGEALNFDDAYCDGVRNYFLQNVIMWLGEYHIDGLRLDAVHAICDMSANHFIQELKNEVLKLEATTGKQKILIAEFDLNNPRYIDTVKKGGFGLDAQWNDEFHHALHSLVTGETNGYYEDFGTLKQLEDAFVNTYVYNGIFSKHRHRMFGALKVDNHYDQFVVFSQNHDQIGNRALGDRLTNMLNFEQLKLVAATVLLSPYVPLLFMGEEYGETNPFLFFVDHKPELAEKVSGGRRKEFSYFNFKDDFPDPQAEETFLKSKLSWNLETESNSTLLAYYKYLIQFRKSHPAMEAIERESMIVHPVGDGKILSFERTNLDDHLLIVLNFGTENSHFLNNTTTKFKLKFDSSAKKWNGSGDSIFGELYPNESITINGMSALIFER